MMECAALTPARLLVPSIAPLRSRHIEGDIIVVDGVPDGYDPSATAKLIRETAE